MTKVVALDINTILDGLLEGRPSSQASAVLLSLCERKQLDCVLCSASVGTIFYLVRKALGSRTALRAVKDLCRIFRVTTVSEQVISSALHAGWPDLEDAIIYESALAGGATHMVTRNAKDFRKAELIVCDAETLITTLAIGLHPKRQ